MSTAVRAAVIVIAGGLVYANSLSSPFFFDDWTSIQQNQQIRQLWPLSGALAPPKDTPVAGRPLVNLSFAINHAIGGLNVTGYRLVNLAIHVVAALVLFGVIRRTLLLPSLAPRFKDHATDLAWAASLIWMAHPLNSEVVNYVTQRTTSMMAVCYLLTMYCSVRALDSTARGRWHIAAVAACATGMACKESMVTAPLMVALFDRVYVAAALRRAAHRRRLYAGLATSWLVLAMLLAERPRTTVGLDTGVGPWTYLLNQTTVIVDYLRLAIWPRGLVLDYGLPQPMILADVIVPALIVLALASAVAAALVFRPRLGFLGAWFFVTLAPTSSIVPIATEVGAERRVYLATAGLVILAVLGAYRMWNWGAATTSSGRLQVLTPYRRRVSTVLVVGTLVCLLAALASATIGRNREYQSWLSLSKTTVERRPHGRAYLHYGTALLEAGRREEAVDYIRRSSEDYPGARFVLGNELIADGDLEAGAEQLERFVEQMPAHVNVVPARETLGSVYLLLGRDDAAAAQLLALLRRDPERRDTHMRLGEIRSTQGRFAEAIQHFRFLVEHRPQDTEALRKLGAALATAGQVESGAAVLERAARMAPRDVAVRLLFGRVLAMAGRLDEAAEQFGRAVDIEPRNDDARRDLARALAQAARLRTMRR
jgi:Flp pilus assembly protein TadD